MILSLTKRNLKLFLSAILSSLLLGLFPNTSLLSQDIDSDLIIKMGFRNDLQEEAGGATVNSFGNLEYGLDRSGNPSCALEFPGSPDDYLQIPVNSQSQLVSNDPFTVSLWFKSTATQSPLQLMFTKGPTFTGGFEVALYDGNTPLTGDRTSGYGLWDNEWNQDPNLWNDQNWHHVVVVKNDQNHVFLYRDGELRNSDTSGDYNIGADALDYHIGKNFVGSLDDVRVYKRALTEIDVTALFGLAADCQATNVNNICLDLESLEETDNNGTPGTYDLLTYPQGTFFFEDKDVKIGLAPWRPNPTHPGFDFGWLWSTSTLTGTQGKILYSNVANGYYDFNEVNGNVNSVGFIVGGDYGQMNISVNGAAYFVGDIVDAPYNIAPGVVMTTNIPTPSGLPVISFHGANIESIVLGNTQGFWVDEICYSTIPDNSSNAECIGFIPFPAGGSYGGFDGQTPGFVVPTFANSEAIVTLEEYNVISGSPTFHVLSLPDFAPIPTILSGIDLNVDFANVPGKVTQVSMDVYAGANYEFSINGEDLIYVANQSSSFPSSMPGGASLSTTLSPSDVTVWDTLHLTINASEIDAFRFGGLDMPFDNICYEYEPSPSCSIENLSVTQYCHDYYVEVDFEHNNAGIDSFDLYLDGNLQGTYLFSALPLGIQFPQGTDQFSTAKVCVNDDPDCCSNIVDINPIGCNPCDQNEIEFFYEPPLCTPNGVYSVTFFVDITNNSDSFTVILDGQYYGTFSYNDDPIVTINSLVGDGTSIYSIEVYDNNNPDCIEGFDIGPIDCSVGNCEIRDLIIEHHDCENGEFYVDIDFNHTATSDSFIVQIGGNPIGCYAYTDLWLTVGPFPSNPNASYDFQIVDKENPDCNALFVLEPIDCPQECNITNIIAETSACDSDGNYTIEIDFDIQNPSGDNFMVIGDGIFYGLFSYASLPITLGPFQSDPNNGMQFNIFDAIDPNCIGLVETDPVDCNPTCDLSGLIIEHLGCQNGVNFYNIDFNYSNPTSDLFTVSALGLNLGTFSYANLPVIVELASSTNTGADFAICDVVSPDCCVYGAADVLDCGNFCPLIHIETEAVECFNGEFYILVEVEAINNPNSNGYTLFANGTSFGPFDYPATTQLIGPFSTSIQGPIEVQALDLTHSCEVIALQEVPVCGNSCEIRDLVIESHGCVNGVNVYEIDFNYSNVTSDVFNITVLGQTYGPYLYADLPINFELDIQQGGDLDIQICDADEFSCCTDATIWVDACNDTCPLLAVLSAPVECIDGEFLIINYVEFILNTPSSGYTIVANGITYGPFTYDEFPDVIGPFSTSLTEPIEVTVIDNNYNNCTVSSLVDIPSCPSTCHITELDVTFNQCTSDSTISITIDFEVINPGNDFFDLYATNGNLVGTYPLAALPLTISDFPTRNTNDDFLLVSINDNPNCFAEIEFETPICNAGCSISDLTATPLDCDNGEFWVVIDFEHQNNPSDQFKLDGNLGADLGTYAYADLPVTVGPFPGDGATVLFFTAYDLTNVDCATDIFLDSPDCNIDCSITNLSANFEGCNPDGTSKVWINFSVNAPSSDFFDVFYDGALVGTYLMDLPMTIPNFPDVNQNQGFDSLTVCVNNDPNCCETVWFDILDCSSDYTCINFEDAPSDPFLNSPNLPAGALLWEYQGVDINLGDCNSSPNGYLKLREAFNTGNNCGNVSNSGNGLFGLDAGIELDFSGHNPLPNELSFDYCGEGFITINGIDSVYFDNTQNQVSINGYVVNIDPFTTNPNSIAGTVSITGELETLTICLLETTIDNICFNSSPPTSENDCVAFEELEDGFSYDLNNHPALLLESADVAVTMQDGILYAEATSTPLWTMFNAASGLHLFIGGGLEFDFTGVGAPLQFVSFDYSGGVANYLTVNGGNPFEFDFNTPDTVLLIAPGVTMFFNRDATNTVEGNISLFGEVQSMVVHGVELAIDNVCYYTDIQEALVWPGDANADNVANHCDLLNIGIAFGEQGPARNNPSIDWDAFDAGDWADFFADGITNFKHSDCDGDGMVTVEDLEVLEINYGLDHGPAPPIVTIPGTPNDPPFFVDLAGQGTLTPGQQLKAPVTLGSFDIPVNGLYGIAFTIEYDPELIIPGTVDIQVKESWLGTPGQDILSIDRSMASQGRIEIAITRIDQLNVNGFGEIAEFIGVIDDIVAKVVNTTIDITNIKAIDFSEKDVILYTPESPGVISTDIEDNKGADGLIIFPVPATDVLSIHNYNPVDIRLITVYNALGQKLVEERYPKNKSTIDVSDWPSGIYFIDIKLPEQVITKKFKVTRL